MLAYFLSILESEEDKKRFTELYEQYHGLIEKTAMGILKRFLKLMVRISPSGSFLFNI